MHTKNCYYYYYIIIITKGIKSFGNIQLFWKKEIFWKAFKAFFEHMWESCIYCDTNTVIHVQWTTSPWSGLPVV